MLILINRLDERLGRPRMQECAHGPSLRLLFIVNYGEFFNGL